MLCISSLVDDVTFSHNRTYGAGDESRVYAQNDSAEGSTDFMSQRILKLTYQGQHGTGEEFDVYDGFVFLASHRLSVHCAGKM